MLTAKNFERIESSETWLDGSGYVWRGIEKKPENSIKEAYVERY